jgi:uracil-DNA glycosylase family 4
MEQLLSEIRNCRVCKEHLPLGPRPVITGSQESKVVIIGQAPGLKVHQSGIPWDDQSGKKLREWLGVDDEIFYDTTNFAIVPMGFCYPGKAKTGDAPPRKECAPLWHDKVLFQLKKVELILLIGSYATSYYLPKEKTNLTHKVNHYEKYLPKYWPLPHPSPTNRFWRAKNPWFEESIVPQLQRKIKEIL